MVRHQIEFAGSTAANSVCFVLAYEVSAHRYYSMHVKEVKDSLVGKPTVSQRAAQQFPVPNLWSPTSAVYEKTLPSDGMAGVSFLFNPFPSPPPKALRGLKDPAASCCVQLTSHRPINSDVFPSCPSTAIRAHLQDQGAHVLRRVRTSRAPLHGDKGAPASWRDLRSSNPSRRSQTPASRACRNRVCLGTLDLPQCRVVLALTQDRGDCPSVSNRPLPWVPSYL